MPHLAPSPRSERAADRIGSLRAAIDAQSRAVAGLAPQVDEQTAQAVEWLGACRGRVVLTGMGKAGLIARKIAATLSSTGTPALYLHPAEALHGDLGVITADDVLVALSNSGETEELLHIVPLVRQRGASVIAITGHPNSTLARHADLVLRAAVDREADAFDLVPTASTTAMLALGDALAVAVLQERGFTREQFALFHAGGVIGRKLLWRVADLMHTGERLPLVPEEATVREALCEMSRQGLGAAFVVDTSGRLAGIFTDGDLRRLLEAHANPLASPMAEVMTRAPRAAGAEMLAAEAVRVMEAHAITVLAIVDERRAPIGILHLHDLVKAGLA